MKIRVIATILLIIALLAGAAAGVKWMTSTMKPPAKGKTNRKPRTVLAPPIRPVHDHRIRIIGYGSARAAVKMEIYPEVSGKVVSKSPGLLSGRNVQAGSVLFQIERTDFQQSLDAADAQIELINARIGLLDQEKSNLLSIEKIEKDRISVSQANLERVQALFKEQAAGIDELDRAKDSVFARQMQLQNVQNSLANIPPRRKQLEAEIQVAKVQQSRSQTALDRTTVKSTITGRVIGCNLEVGERVQAGTHSGELYGTSVMEVPVSVPASEFKWIDTEFLKGEKTDSQKISAKVQWSGIDDSAPISWKGYVDRIEAGLEAKTRTAVLVIRVKNPDNTSALHPLDRNMFCKVFIDGKKLSEVFILPRRAILPGQRVYYVKDGKLAITDVKVARYTRSEAIILPDGGLHSGMRVILENIPRVIVGMSVKPVNERIFPSAALGQPTTSTASQPCTRGGE